MTSTTSDSSAMPLLTALRVLPKVAFEASHPATVLRAALPPEHPVYGWWAPANGHGGTHLDFPDLGWSALVAWHGPEGLSAFAVDGRTPDLWDALTPDQRRERLVMAAMVSWSSADAEALIDYMIPAGDGEENMCGVVGQLIWGLLHLVPAPRRAAVRTMTVLKEPLLGRHLIGDESRGFWTEPPRPMLATPLGRERR